MPTALTGELAPTQSASLDLALAPHRRLSNELYDFVGRAVGPDFVQHLARFVGEDEARTETALTLLFSAAVRRIARAAESREATERLLALLHGQQVAVDLSSALALLLGRREAERSKPSEAADAAAHALYGSRAGSLVLSVGAATGMQFDSVWNLGCLLTPFAYAALADYCTRHDLDAAGLRKTLASERNESRRSHRRRIDRTLSESGSRAVEAAFDGGARAIQRTRAAFGEARSRLRSIKPARLALPGLLVATVAGASVFALGTDHPEMPTTNAAGARALTSVALPDGQSLQVPRDGVIDRMVAFLSDERTHGAKVFLIEGMRFDDQSATLRSASLAQLEPVAMVLVAFPGARVDIEASSERLGDPDREKELAEQRALAIRATLGSFGVRPSRMTHANSGDPSRGASGETGSLRFSDGLVALRVTSR